LIVRARISAKSSKEKHFRCLGFILGDFQ